jgi:hypothetical protein
MQIEIEESANEAFQALFEIFSQPMKPFKGMGRTYVLELVGGQPVFRRDEIDLLFDRPMKKAFGSEDEDRGDDIVPKKLNNLFPDPRRAQNPELTSELH